MSEQPIEAQEPSSATPPPASPTQMAGPAWFQLLSSVLFVIFCFELGMFLLVYPWTSAWTENSISLLAPARLEDVWRHLWNSSYARGGVSGMGLVNIWIAIAEVFRMFGARGKS